MHSSFLGLYTAIYEPLIFRTHIHVQSRARHLLLVFAGGNRSALKFRMDSFRKLAGVAFFLTLAVLSSPL